MMRLWFTLLVVTATLVANTHPYRKTITVPAITQPTLIQIKLDNELYQHTGESFQDIRLIDTTGKTEGYFIQPYQAPTEPHTLTLAATEYDRDHAAITYRFDQPFEIETIELHIDDRNFESLMDLAIDGKLISSDHKIFDYTQETGNRNFTITTPKIQATEVTIRYHLEQTQSFYKKYKHIQEQTKYLTIKSATFSNHNPTPIEYDITTVPLQSLTTQEQATRYIFASDHIPTTTITPIIQESNYNRSGILYLSEDQQQWSYQQPFEIKHSNLTDINQTEIPAQTRSRFLQLQINNQDNPPLTLTALKLVTLPNYLYFIAQPNTSYYLYFGDITLEQPHYEIADLVNRNTPFVQGRLSALETLEVTPKTDSISWIEQYKEGLFIIGIVMVLGILFYIAFGLVKKPSSSS